MEAPNIAFDRTSVEAQLERLWAQDSLRVRWLAARHALRSLLLLSMIKDPFADIDYLPDSKNQSESSAANATPSQHFLSLYYAAKLSYDHALEELSQHITAELTERVDQYRNGARIVREQLRNTDLRLQYGIAYAVDAAIVLAHSDASESDLPYFGVALEKCFEFEDGQHQRFTDAYLKIDVGSILQDWQQWFSDDLKLAATLKADTIADNLALIPITAQGMFIEAFEQMLQQFQQDNSQNDPRVFEHVYQDYQVWFASSTESDKPEVKTKPSSHMSAEAIRSTQDHLGRAPLVQGLARILGRKENTHHTTIGLFGHWGSGKTRVLDLLKKELSLPPSDSEYHQADFLFAEFNAWEYEHAKNIQAAMAHVVITALMQPPGRYRRKLKKQSEDEPINSIDHLQSIWEWLITRPRVTVGFVLRKHPLQTLLLIGLTLFAVFSADNVVNALVQPGNLDLVTKALGFSLPVVLLAIGKNLRTVMSRPFTKELMTYLKLPSYAAHVGMVPEMQEDVKKMVEASLIGQRRLLLIVDDLDRCDPEGIIKTFEAIRLVMTIEKVSIIIAIDQRIALAALAHKYKTLAEHHELKDPRSIAHDYLGKMIHLPITLDIPMGEERLGYLQYIWQDDDSFANLWKAPARQWQETNAEPANKTEYAAEQTMAPIRDVVSFAAENQPTVDELNQWLLSFPEPAVIHPTQDSPEVVYGLSTEQKAAFAYWSRHFELANPRLLKRLNNSYNLIRLVSGVEDYHSPNEHIEHHAFAIILTLMLLEFINGQEHSSIRKDMRNAVIHHQPSPSLLNKKDFKQMMAFLDDWCLTQDAFEDRKALIEFTDLFILPAIATEESDQD